jgi:hypothetical protein
MSCRKLKKNQRISWLYPFADRRNYMFAEAGARSEDLADQVDAILASYPLATCVTVFIGQNDICRDIDEEITPVNEYVHNVGTALDELAAGLDLGSTILVVGPVDVTRLYEVARDKRALGIVDCEVLWFFSLKVIISSPEKGAVRQHSAFLNFLDLLYLKPSVFYKMLLKKCS